MKDDRDNFIADACVLMERGMTAEEVYTLIDAAIGLFGAVNAETETEKVTR